MSQENVFTDNGVMTSYRQEDIGLRSSRNKIACLLIFILMFLGSIFDYLIYPDLANHFITIRLGVVILITVIYLLHRSTFGKNNTALLGIVLVLSVNFSFCLMLYYSEGVFSRYHALHLILMLGGGVLLAWTVAETVFTSTATLFMYLTSCYLHSLFISPINDLSILFNNGDFIILSAVISVVNSHFYTKARINDFILRARLDSRNEEFEKLTRLRTNFFANVSHELRTPLTLILAPVQDLLRTPDILNENITSLLRVMQDNALRLLKLVNDLLEVIKLEEGKANLASEPIELNSFISATVNSVSQYADTRTITLSTELCSSPTIVNADSYALERIFLNLLSNAIKFTPRGGCVEIKSKIVGNNSAAIDISDTGMGIDSSEIPHIFDRYHQAGNSCTRKYSGTGLGLSLVKELVENMQGTIDVDSSTRHGTTMHLRFPLSNTAYQDYEIENMPCRGDVVENLYRIAEYNAVLSNDSPFIAEESVLQMGSKPSILIVDRNTDMRNYLACGLEKQYRLILARNGMQGLILAQKYIPDLILLDRVLPEVDALEVCKKLKSVPETMNIKILVLTDREDDSANLAALENGADDFIIKPFSILEIETRVKNLMATAELEKELIVRMN